MKSLRVFFVFVAMMMSLINAMDDFHSINFDSRYFTGDGIGDKGQTLLHLLALYCGSVNEVTVTFCPATLENQATQSGADQFFVSESKIKEFVNNKKEFIIAKFVQLARIKDSYGKTPLDILDERRCNTKLCNVLKKQLLKAAALNAAEAKISDLMEDLER